MARKVRGGLLSAALAVWLAAHASAGLAQELPPSPIPVAPQPDDTPTAPPPRPMQPAPVPAPAPRLAQAPAVAPAPGVVPGYPPSPIIIPPPPPPGPVVGAPPWFTPSPPPGAGPNGGPPAGSGFAAAIFNPWNDRPPFPPPGWFGEAEIDVVGVHVKNRLLGPVNIDGFTNNVHVPGSELGWVGSPRVTFGYRLPNNYGDFSLGYQLLQSEGDTFIENFDVVGLGVVRSRLTLNAADLTYGSPFLSFVPGWDLKWRVGLKTTTVFYDSQAAGVFMEERASDSFWGIGPSTGLDSWLRLNVPGLALFTRIGAAAQFGRVNQSFEQTFTFADGSMLGGATRQTQLQTAVPFELQAGLAYTPQWAHYARFTVGYTLQHWFLLGMQGPTLPSGLVLPSNLELNAEGLFFRGEFVF